jgi:predicted enzyme related to lactoylglutathione lyase
MSTIDKHQNGTPSWFDLMTPDPEGARKFYGSLFGWTYVVGGPESGHYSMCKIGDRNAAGIGSPPPGPQMASVWTVYFNVDDLDATLASIKSNNGNVVMGPMDVMTEGRLAVAADPTGPVFGLWQPKNHKGAGVRDEHGAMAWQEAHTTDAAKAREFYARVFKLEPVKLEGADYWTLNRGKDVFGGVYQNDKLPPGVPPHWLPYFAVDDADKAAATVKTGGGKIMQEPFDTPHGRMAVAVDPWGAGFAFIKPPKR